MAAFSDFFKWLFLWLVVMTVSSGEILKHCDKDSYICEIVLDIDHWLPMRVGPNQKVFINATDGKVYQYNDDSGKEIDPNDVILADGTEHERVLALFNRSMPGPTLVVYQNQEVVVHVTNHMLSDGVSVHFHGIEMRGTPWMDGASFVTQCPIMPGQSFTYRFRPNRVGTYYYHAHLGMQMGMGLVAPFIVKDRKAVYTNEHIMTIQDYNNRYAGDDVAANARLGLFYPGGKNLGLSKTIDGYYTTLLELTSTLVNGRGRVYDENGQATTNTPLHVFNVVPGALQTFRVIHAGYAFQYKVSVDSHKITIIAMDGNEIEPVEADYVILHTGERADFTITTSQAVDNYWIRVETLQVSNGQPGYAILRYENAPDFEPTTMPRECNETNKCIVVNCPFASTDSLTCINAEDLNNADADDDAPVPESPDKFKEFFLNVGFAYNDKRSIVGHINGVSHKLSTVSALTQPSEVSTCDASHDCGPEKLCFCNRPLNVNFGDVVQITFMNMGYLSFFHHPMHIHGYSFHVTKVGYGELNQTSGKMADNSAIECNASDQSKSYCNNNPTWKNRDWLGGNIPGQRINKAIRKDTVTVPANSYVTVRFKADNPGLWYIHCHMELHVAARGMAILLNDSFSRIPAPPAGFPECRNFNSVPRLSDGLINKPTNAPSTTITTKSPSNDALKAPERTFTQEEFWGMVDVLEAPERTFTQEEFWGMVGALLFVIVFQFVISGICIRRGSCGGSQTKYSM